MKIFRRIVSLCTAVILSATVCGCSQKKEDTSSQNKDDGVTRITWWAFPVFSQENAGDAAGTYEKKIIKAFEKENKDIEVKFQAIDFESGPDKLSSAVSNGKACDVLFDAPGRIISYGKQGKLVSLEDMFTEEFVNDVDNEALLSSCKDGDTPYMYPLSSAPFYMAFNKAYLEDAGVYDLVKEGWTTDDFTTVITALKNEGYVAGSFFCKNQSGDQGTRAFSANLFNSEIVKSDLSEYTINDNGGIKAFDYIKTATDNGTIMNGSYLDANDAIAAFVRGSASYTLLWGPNQQAANQSALDMNGIETVEVPFPSQDGTPELEYLVNGFCVFDNNDSKKAEASKKLIKFICDNEEWGKQDVVRTGCIPVRTSFGDLYSSERMNTISKWTQYYSVYYNTIDGFSDMRKAWYMNMQALLDGGQTAQECGDNFVKQANDTIS